MKRGRPFEPGNKLGRGRPKGSRNKRSLLAQELLDHYSEPIARKALQMALQGDGPMIRTLLSYMMSRPKELPCKLGGLPMDTVEDLSKTFATTLTKVSSGQITTHQAQDIFGWIESRRRLLETQDLTQRVSALEDAKQLRVA